MKINSSRQTLLRNYADALFYSNKYPISERRYCFFLIIFPTLEFMMPELIALGLETNEAISELFILSSNLFNNFDIERSSIIPYLEKHIPWKIKEMFDKLDKTKLIEKPIGLTVSEYGNSYMDMEFYWKNILFEESWIGKCFTRSEKCLISRIITSDINDLTINSLARRSNIGRKKLKQMLLEIKKVLKSEENND